jgi:DNA polymerase III epsilon subunit family exonuclease
MSVGGFTVVSVTRAAVITRAPGGYGAVPLARPGPHPVGSAGLGSDLVGSAGLGSDLVGSDLLGSDPVGLAGRDLGRRDLGRRDLGRRDLGRRDLGQRDLGQRDLGQRDLGQRDLGQRDLGQRDLGQLEFAVIDLETTGWSPEAAAITEIAAVRVRGGRRQGEFASLVNPGVPVPPGIEALTGITDWMLAAAPKLGAVLPGLLGFAGGCVLVAHNAPFDIGFLVAACGDCGLAWPGFTVLDTVMLARQVMDPDEVPDCKLGTLAGFFRARTAPSHRALADARATADVLGWLIRRLAHRGVRTLSELSSWPEVVA